MSLICMCTICQPLDRYKSRVSGSHSNKVRNWQVAVQHVAAWEQFRRSVSQLACPNMNIDLHHSQHCCSWQDSQILLVEANLLRAMQRYPSHLNQLASTAVKYWNVQKYGISYAEAIPNVRRLEPNTASWLRPNNQTIFTSTRRPGWRRRWTIHVSAGQTRHTLSKLWLVWSAAPEVWEREERPWCWKNHDRWVSNGLKLSPTTPPKIQDPFVLWVALQANGSIHIFVLSNNKTQRTILSANGSSGEMILRFRLCLSWHPKWVLHIGTLLEAICIVLETYFGFGFCNGSPVGYSLKG